MTRSIEKRILHLLKPPRGPPCADSTLTVTLGAATEPSPSLVGVHDQLITMQVIPNRNP